MKWNVGRLNQPAAPHVRLGIGIRARLVLERLELQFKAGRLLRRRRQTLPQKAPHKGCRS
jgi:hypothetical protein